MNIYSIYDVKANAWLRPFFERNNSVAIRSFADAANEKDHAFQKHGADFTLFMIGSWDEDAGQIMSMETNENLGNGLSHQKEN